MDENLWKTLSDKVLWEVALFRLIESQRRNSSGAESRFYVLDTPDWVNVIPLLDGPGGRELLMVRQFRHGSGLLTLEFPGGVVDPGEDPLVAARRELQEETAYKAGRLLYLGAANPNPAYMNNRAHTYLALDLEINGLQDLDEFEDVEVERVPESLVLSQMGRPPFDHGVMMMALHWYRQWKDAGEPLRDLYP